MRIFGKKTALQVLEEEHGNLTIPRDRLAKETEAARLELQRAEDGQTELLTQLEAADPKAKAAAQRRVELATATLRASEIALAKIEEKTLKAQRLVDQERQIVENNSAADAIEKYVLTFEKTVDPASTALRALSKAASELDYLNFEVDGISRYAHVAASELEIAAALAIAEIRSKATAVRGGHDRIPVPAPPPAPPQPAPAVQRIWTLKPIAWKQDGQIRKIDLNEQVDLSPTLAEKAISATAAVPVGDSRFGKLAVSSRRWNGYTQHRNRIGRLSPFSEYAPTACAIKPNSSSKSNRSSPQWDHESRLGGLGYILTRRGEAVN